MIGIITPYNVANYGTKLQAYAMQVMLEKYDQCEILGFVTSSDKRFGSLAGKIFNRVDRLFHRRKKIIETENMRERKRGINKFDKYYRVGAAIYGNKALEKEIKKYDSVVCGSDQLWAPLNVMADYTTMTLVPDNINKVSYAASFGVEMVPKYMEQKYRRYLSRINHISVREEQGRILVEQLADRKSKVVLDPTLMVEVNKWDELSQSSNINIDEAYVFCYFLGTNKKHREFAKKLADMCGMKLVTIPHFKEWNSADEGFGDIQLYNAGPVEFVSLIKNAKYICTDSFHGTVFSILFHKQVAVFERFNKNDKESTNSRIYSLMEKLGISKQLCEDESDVKKIVSEGIDYVSVEMKLQDLKKDSWEFLDNSLRGKEND